MEQRDGKRAVWGAALAGLLGAAIAAAAAAGRGDAAGERRMRPGLRERPGDAQPGEAHGEGPDEVCATGCSATTYVDDVLTEERYRRLLAAWAGQPSSAQGQLALETLLFYGEQTRALGWKAGFGELAAGREAFLARELARDHAWLSVRLVNAAGRMRLELLATRVPLGVKQHIVAERTTDLQPPEVSGTVKRVGLRHLWVRL